MTWARGGGFVFWRGLVFNERCVEVPTSAVILMYGISPLHSEQEHHILGKKINNRQSMPVLNEVNGGCSRRRAKSWYLL